MPAGRRRSAPPRVRVSSTPSATFSSPTRRQLRGPRTRRSSSSASSRCTDFAATGADAALEISRSSAPVRTSLPRPCWLLGHLPCSLLRCDICRLLPAGNPRSPTQPKCAEQVHGRHGEPQSSSQQRGEGQDCLAAEPVRGPTQRVQEASGGGQGQPARLRGRAHRRHPGAPPR